MKRTQKPPSRSPRRGAFASPAAPVLAILDPLRGPGGPYNLKKDSSHLLALELSRRGHTIFCSDPAGLIGEAAGVKVRVRSVSVTESEPFFILGGEELFPLERFPLILMRKDPPVDQVYLHATHLLSQVSNRVWIINNPRALRDWNEKLVIRNFPRWIPKTLVTSSKHEIDRFVQDNNGAAVIKLLDSFGGQGVRKLIRDREDYLAILGEMTSEGRRPVMLQEFLPQVSQGEKRIFMIDGKPLGALLRIPPEGDFLTNPDLGGHLAATGLGPHEKKLCAEVGPFLKKHGIFFAGIDVIGGRLTEVNITSPGLLWEWNEVDNQKHEKEIVDAIEKRM